MANKPHSSDELANLSAEAIAQARARKARVLDEAELEQAAGGAALVKLEVPIIYGLIFPGDIFKQSPLSLDQVVTAGRI